MVKDKEGLEDPKAFLQIFIFQSNCQFSLKFWIRPGETDVFIVKTHPMFKFAANPQPLNLEL